MAKVKIKLKKRMFSILFAFVVLMSLLVVRIVWIQAVDGWEYRKMVEQQQTRDTVIAAKRGTIYDRNNKILAQSASVEKVCVYPNIIKEEKAEEEVAKTLSEILGLDYDSVFKKVTNNSYYEVIKSKLEKPLADKIREADLVGVGLEEDVKRYYPFGNFASQIIGVTGTDNQGLSGVELIFDADLKGIDGKVISAKNAQGTDMPFKYEAYQEPKDGSDIVLTIDETIQHFTEKYLETAAIDYSTKEGAAAIVMDVKTGEILAMATYPSFDLNKPFEIVDENVLMRLSEMDKDSEEYKNERANAIQKMWRNKAVSDSYEPGSTFKIAVLAAALEAGVTTESDTFFCPGFTQVGNWIIKCHKTTGHGSQTLSEAVQNSCNCAFMELGARLGTERYRQYFEKFGFSRVTGFDLPGETKGIFFKPENFNKVELATSSFGQGFQITPLQLITAIGGIVNGGKMVKPQIIREIKDGDTVIRPFAVENIDTIVSEENSKKIALMLEEVVSKGTGKNAYIKGYRVGGKTGTSEKNPRSERKIIASFLGIAPADDPQVICLVMLDEPPTMDAHSGGTIAAPVVGKILEEVLRYKNVQPQYTSEELAKLDVSVPDVRGGDVNNAVNVLKKANLAFRVVGNNPGLVTSQVPAPGAKLSASSVVILYTEGAQPVSDVDIPDLAGKTLTEANQIVTSMGLNFKVVGAGSTATGSLTSIVKQDPLPGVKVGLGSVVSVEFVNTEGIH